MNWTPLPVPWAVHAVDRIPKQRYYDEEFYALEAELFWPRVWQMACRLEEIPSRGDFVEYEILDQSVIVVRLDDDNVRALNALRRSFPDYSQMKPEEMTREQWDVFYPLAYWDIIVQESKARNLDPYQVAMEPHSELAKAQRLDGFLAAFHRLHVFDGHRSPVRDARA